MSDPTATELVTQWLTHSPFVGHLGLKLASISDGRASVTLPYREEHTTMGDGVHGGAIAALVDSAATAACWAGAEVPKGMRGTTVSIALTYIAAGRASDLTADATVARRGAARACATRRSTSPTRRERWLRKRW